MKGEKMGFFYTDFYTERDRGYGGGKERVLNLKRVLLVAIPAFIVFLIFVTNIFIIHAGEVGTRFNPFSEYRVLDAATNQYVKSSVSPQEYSEGIHIKPPWVRVDRYNTKTQDYTMSLITEEGELARDDRVRTVTSEGLYVGLDITVLYRLNSAMADSVRRTIGTEGEYQQIVVRPAIRSAIREVVSAFEAADIYGTGRTAVQSQIFSTLSHMLDPRGIVVESVLLRDVELPEEITKAIEAKKQAEQEALRMEYILQREKLEKERKLIEAEGISAANLEIAGSLTSEYLTWYWINNLENHESVVYLIPSDSGLPLFKSIP
jgi:prohibitin 2